MKNKIGFVDGTCKRDSFDASLRGQCDCYAFVLSWIMNVVAKDLYSGVFYGLNAASVWRELKERFDKRNISRIYKLHQEIMDLTQGLGSVFAYYSKLRDL